MKKLALLCAIVAFLSGLAYAGENSKPASKAASSQPDYLSMPWDQLVAAAKREGQVVLYFWYDPQYFNAVAKAFHDKYGINVTAVHGSETANFQKILAEKASATGTIDVSVVGGAETRPTIENHLVYGPLESRIPDADKIPAAYWKTQEGVELGGYLAPYMRNQVGLLYDPKRVSDPPQTWDQLNAWIDAHPGQFGFANAGTGAGSGEAMVMTILKYTAGGLEKYYGDTSVVQSKVADWSKAWDWVNQRKGKIVITASNNQSAELLNSGELSLVAEWDDIAVRMLRNGELPKDVKMYIPRMGLAGGGDSLGVLANAPHKAAAILLISFILSKPEQEALNAPSVGLFPAYAGVYAPNTLVPAQDRKYSLAWIPSPYKALWDKDFEKYVIMK